MKYRELKEAFSGPSFESRLKKWVQERKIIDIHNSMILFSGTLLKISNHYEVVDQNSNFIYGPEGKSGYPTIKFTIDDVKDISIVENADGEPFYVIILKD